ncbi:PTS sugar transporter subunit IIB [Brevibacillus sp. 7WMA2]|uniref:Lichenan-specific phosphotransferase enzyme IIB component n=1 Tax=Brevibacillus laterosporus LMG 15441 TaxID=1042163 RepID=A0A075R6N5_BRELA|nr:MULTISPECIES: PTS sugar transporter subunit IIB [Brevibacillus]AIG27509.1 lichenan-specific phosphotransferase enzyme IIB component [Brevibacillus laterosporus LMG 15441]AUM65794.1 PTS sugar transporter subunit IIB [Brevibacillus laterosporus]AYK08786.1 PTS sugar transporter subunit IIB [Brevibacillus laterosporus]MBA4532391.1 PTS sugar transporter subunit IIB [Brevibacillus halotolerans]MCR8962530.1 PTS sugar transporter subunit IIB [Brevibacillus laterosporus]
MNIVLCCSAGMSTSLLVTRMEEAAKEQGIEATIWAISADDMRDNWDKAEVVLLGPQIRYKLAEFKKEGEARNIPVDVINPVDYGMVNGQKVLEAALHMKK